MTYAGILAAAMFLGAGLGAGDAIPPQQSEELTRAFDTLALGPDEAVESAAKPLLLELAAKPDAYHTFLSAFFLTHPYTPGVADFWSRWVAAPGESQMAAATASGACVVEALAATLNADMPDLTVAQAALQWLDYLASGLDKRGMEYVANACNLALTGKRPNIAGLLGEQPGTVARKTTADTPAAMPSAATTPKVDAPPIAGAPPYAMQTPPVEATPPKEVTPPAGAIASEDSAPPADTPVVPEPAPPVPASIPTPDGMRIAMQTCLTLSRFKEASTLGEWLTLSADMQLFLSRTGILLFDHGVLTGQHLQSFESLLQCFPIRPALSAALVPEAMGGRAAEWNLSAPQGVIELPAIAMDVFSMPAEFSGRTWERAVPEFTLTVAGELFHALQYDAFINRPQLVEWRNSLLASAGALNARYLRHSIAPAYFQANPDDFLPATAYLWFLDSARSFDTALELLMLLQGEPMSSLLLLADILTGGTDTTLLFSTDTSGVVSSQTTSVRRVMAAPGISVVNAIAIEGRWYQFEVDEYGVVRGYVNDGDETVYVEGETAMQTPPVQNPNMQPNAMQPAQGFGQQRNTAQPMQPYGTMQQGYGAQQYYYEGENWSSAY